MNRLALLVALTIWASGNTLAGDVRVAVASNFQPTLRAVAREFEATTGHRVVVSPGSTGRLYAQIVNGAPYDVFLAADAARPERLADETPGASNFSYATGKLVVWTSEDQIPEAWSEWLRSAAVERIAIANPRHAPYGQAAQQVLQHADVPANKLVVAENVGQAFQFAASGNATAGLVALSQAQLFADGSWVEVPAETYEPILQQGVQLNNAEVTEAFVQFLLGDEAAAIIRQDGYSIPDNRNP